jgi:hypothetical protein
MLQTRHPFLASPLLLALVLLAPFVTAHGQTTSPADTKLSLRAALVLSPEFCATSFKPKGSWVTKEMGTFKVGQAACEELEPALKGAFTDLVRVAAAPPPEDAQVILLPRLIDADASKSFGKREIVVLLEWTVKDKFGKTVWIETVQGSAKHGMGNAFTHGKDMRLIVTDSVKDLAQQSASKMVASPELRKLTQ